MVLDEISDFDLVMSMPDIEKYVGKWVAVVNHKVVAIGDSLEDVYITAITKHPEGIPFITKIPEEQMLLL